MKRQPKLKIHHVFNKACYKDTVSPLNDNCYIITEGLRKGDIIKVIKPTKITYNEKRNELLITSIE